MIDQLFREAKANAKTLQRANSVPSDKLEQRSRLPRLMSHEPKLETEVCLSSVYMIGIRYRCKL